MDMNEVKKIVSEDKDTKDLQLNEEELLIAYQYILQRDDNSLKGVRPRLRLKPFLHIDYVPTKEKLLEEKRAKLKRNLETFESDVYISKAKFDDVTILNDNYEKAIDYMKEFIELYPKFKKGLFLHGPYRTGKSFLLSALANELVSKNIDVVFAFIPDLARAIKGSMNTQTLESKMNILKRTSVLILDDLGGEYLSPWFRDEILLPILQYRLNANLPVFIASNLTLRQLATFLEVESDSGSMKSARIMQRILDLTIPVEFTEKYEKPIE
ncbi:ATP-binding protein [Acholeplasma hippikon]|uniref:Primosomal protein DnaI n=1 Tax=Acholeplasma hippikon TaxID=264636 RepID=A0A449BJJ8_9MOLU|nr:ATP-binding protein [Acholeplasma hippikon]VEU82641.1 Primosomal protein DnaI [Acholeplasma hippikon]